MLQVRYTKLCLSYTSNARVIARPPAHDDFVPRSFGCARRPYGSLTILPDGWEQIGTVAHPNGAVDARTSRIVTFELAAADLSAGQRFLLLTVVSAQPDPVTAAGLQGATVRDLVLNSRHAAARSVRLE